MVASRKAWIAAGTAVAVLGFALSSTIGAAQDPAKTSVNPRVSLLARGGIGSFTPAAADPRLAALMARSDLTSTGFRFTPTGDAAKNRKVTVAVRARTSRPAAQAFSDSNRALDAALVSTVGITPSAYNLGASIGWKRFALSGDVARIDTGLIPGSTESVRAGASYNAPRWSGRVQLDAERGLGVQPRAIVPEKSYSLDLGGSYRLTRNLDVTAGVRYKMQDRDRLQPLADDRRDSQALYVGTAFKF